MEFELKEDHVLIRQKIKYFLEQEVIPLVEKEDEFACYKRSILRLMGKYGILGLCIPEQYGGGGFDNIALSIACEEMEKVDTGARINLSVHLALSSMSILKWGSEYQLQNYLIPQTKGEIIGAFALTESTSGSDIKNIHTTAVDHGDHYTLNGQKMWVSLIDVANTFLVFAKNAKNNRISCFIVDRDSEGLETSTIYGKMSLRLGNTGKLILNDVKVPRANLLGRKGDGYRVALSAVEAARFTAAAGAVGIISACLEKSIQYAKEREAFGKKIENYQLIKEKIAEMSANLEISRLLVYKAGWLRDNSLPSFRESSLAKWIACESALKAAIESIQIHGAYAYLNSFPSLERFMRNAKESEIYSGTKEILQLIVADYELHSEERHMN